ncbi:MAG: AmmeMemoRadiSam system radical SAM enzyme [Fibrobacter sp.]|nr:AmmeMemoRadiSam system radical SAM enzyme [Fibrobacter sp.]
MHEAICYEKLDNSLIKCELCAHGCVIENGRLGFCKVRKNIDGKLYSLNYQKLIAKSIDPIEKKPLYHFLPGTESFSIALPGCNFRCKFCQNWHISQVDDIEKLGRFCSDETPYNIVDQALRLNCKSISFTYTEPTVFFEYAYRTAKIAKQKGLYTVFVTNGFMSPKAVELISPYLDACNVDLKSFSDDFYRENCSAKLEPVLDCIKRLNREEVWVEITTLFIPGKNDSEREIEQIAKFISELDINIPWHISRFFPNYKFSDLEITSDSTIKTALRIASDYGLKYVYPGNVGQAFNTDTICHKCGNKLIERNIGYAVRGINMICGKCPSCSEPVSGVW